MRAHGQTSVWNHHHTVGWDTPRTTWFQQLYNWWMLYTATRRDNKLAALSGCWDAHCEGFKAVRAESASEMAASHGALSVATQLYGLSV